MGMYRLTFGATGGTPLAVGGMLQQALSNLPVIDGGYSNGSPEQRHKYDMFVQAFGTHYVAGADFGAHCSFDTSLSKSYASKMSSHFVSEQISISIGIEMGNFGISTDIGFGNTKNDTEIDKTFAQHARSGRICKGGIPALLTQHPPQYDKWVQSVYKAPAWINGTAVLRPIADLLVGEDASAKRECLRDAVISYMEA